LTRFLSGRALIGRQSASLVRAFALFLPANV